MPPKNLLQALLTVLAAALCVLTAAFPRAAGAQEIPRYRFVDTGRVRDFVLATDEVYLQWRGAAAPANPRAQIDALAIGATVLESGEGRALVKLSRRLDEAKLKAGTDEFSVAFPGVQVLPVLYQAGVTRDKGTRRVVMSKLLVALPAGQSPAQVGALVGASAAQESARAGVAILEVGGPYRVLEALDVLRKAGIAANPLLGHSWFARTLPIDQFFPDQWHLHNTGQSGSLFGIDANVLDAWQITLGAGITIGIVDSCLQIGHPDLAPNTPPVNSGLHFDFLDDDADPNPHFGDNHGTSVAGVSAARQNNGPLDAQTGTRLGVSGSSPESRLLGLRLINESAFVPVTDLEESTALFWKPASNNNLPVIDVSNNSWGPGNELVGPDILTQTALRDATLFGRGGKGQITLFAAGNSQQFGTDGNFNGYGNSRYVIAVGAIDNLGRQSFYSQNGANVLVSAPSNGGTLGIVTTDDQDVFGYNPPFPPTIDLPNTDYTNSFGGTSSATPLVAGVASLLLAANADLGWRDVKEILTATARQVDVGDLGWDTNPDPAFPGVQDNGAGFKFSHKYGGGMVDASAAVVRALDWTNLGQELVQVQNYPANQLPLIIPDANPAGVPLDFDFTGPNFPNLRVETVEVTLDIDHGFRSDLEIFLISPDGTTSTLVSGGIPQGDNADYKYAVFANAGIVEQGGGWTFTSVHHWGENSTGTWQVLVVDSFGADIGQINSATIRLYGTSSPLQRFKFEYPRYQIAEPENNAPGNAPRELKVNVQRLGTPAGTVSVKFVTSPRGTATASGVGAANPDYLPIGGTLLFGDGQTSQEISIPILHDTLSEETESIYLLLKDPVGGSLGGVTLATVEVTDNDENRVTVTATQPEITEPTEGVPTVNGVFTISRTVPSSQPLIVSFSIAGTATPGLGIGDDYLPIPFTATIPANETSTTVTIEPRDDENIEGVETVDLALISDASYSLGVPSTAQIRINDNDRASVQITITANGVLQENDPARIATLHIGRTDDTSLPLTVNLLYSGNQINGAQYLNADTLQPLPASVIIPAGQSGLDLHLRPVNDAAYQASKKIVITLGPSAAYTFAFGFLSSATLTVIEDDPLPDSNIPTLKINTPKKDARFVSTAAVTVTGTAADNTKLVAIEFSANGRPWTPVPGVAVAATANWTFTLNPPNHAAPELVFGPNQVKVRAVDEDGNRSQTAVVNFTFVKERQVTVAVIGPGTVDKLLGTSALEIGKLYTVTAKPVAGKVFKGWTNLASVTGTPPTATDRTISFVLSDGAATTIQADFIDSPFGATIAGDYSGLARSYSPPGNLNFTFGSSGLLTFKVTPTGSFTGKFLIGGVSYPLKGEFSGTGIFQGKIPRKDDLPFFANLTIDLTVGGTQRVTGTISTPTFNLTAQADRAAFGKGAPAPAAVAGKQFTFALPPNNPLGNADFDPRGNGYGTVLIDPAGKVTMKGTLGDGTGFKLTQMLSKTLTWPFFLDLYKHKGVVIGLIAFDPGQADSDVNGVYSWFKPSTSDKAPDKYFPFGFSIEENDFLGSLYTPPAGGRALGGFTDTADNALIVLADGNLIGPITKFATFDNANVITISEATSPSKGEGLKLKVDPKAGTFSGTFIHPLGGKAAKVGGVLFQKQQTGIGGFPGLSLPGVPLQTGKVTIDPR